MSKVTQTELKDLVQGVRTNQDALFDVITLPKLQNPCQSWR